MGTPCCLCPTAAWLAKLACHGFLLFFCCTISCAVYVHNRCLALYQAAQCHNNLSLSGPRAEHTDSKQASERATERAGERASKPEGQLAATQQTCKQILHQPTGFHHLAVVHRPAQAIPVKCNDRYSHVKLRDTLCCITRLWCSQKPAYQSPCVFLHGLSSRLLIPFAAVAIRSAVHGAPAV